MSESAGCCACCCKVIFSLGLTALFMWLSTRASSPVCTLEYFYIPAFDQTLNTSNSNSTLNFTVRLKNTNKDKGVYYDPVNVTFSDSPGSNKNRPTIANFTIPRFYQGHNKKAFKGENGVQTVGLDRDKAFRAISANGSAVFRVDLATRVRYKIVFWKTKRYRIEVGADVQVNGNGTKGNGTVINRRGIKLKSGADKIEIYGGKLAIFLVGFFVFFLLG